jgi:hypothetical protein
MTSMVLFNRLLAMNPNQIANQMITTGSGSQVHEQISWLLSAPQRWSPRNDLSNAI